MTAHPIAGAHGAPSVLFSNPSAAMVLRADGAALRKTVQGGAVATPKPPRLYDMEVADARDLAALFTLLMHLDDDPSRCLIRAAPTDPRSVRGVRRTVRVDAETGELPTLRDVPRLWFGGDVDGLAAPPGNDPRDLAAAAGAIRAALPAEMREAGMILHASASAGIKPGIRARAWFILSHPCIGADLAAWLGGTVPGLDPATLRPAQIHYTCRPRIIGAPDPVPERLLLLDGPPVAVPDLRPYRRPPPPPDGQTWGGSAGSPERAVGRFAALLRTVANTGEGQRHPVLFWAACRAGEMVAGGDLGREAAADALASAVTNPGDRSRHLANLTTARAGIARGMAEAR